MHYFQNGYFHEEVPVNTVPYWSHIRTVIICKTLVFPLSQQTLLPNCTKYVHIFHYLRGSLTLQAALSALFSRRKSGRNFAAELQYDLTASDSKQVVTATA
jgi:hypothetical protein